MKFLKEIIARRANAPDDGFYSSMAMEQSECSAEPATAPADEPYDAEFSQPARPEGFDHPNVAPVEHDRSGTSGGDDQAPYDILDAAEDTAGAMPTSEQDQEILKIWEMFDEKPAKSDEPKADDAENFTQQELAREAMKSMIVPPPARPAAAPEAAPVNAVALSEAKPPQVQVPLADVAPVARAGRAKTRMLGFHNSDSAVANVFDQAETRPDSTHDKFPVGWLVLIEGPGRGASFTLKYGVSSIGRGDNQTIKLDFGDTSISREGHASIAYDEDLNAFFIGHGGKSNLVRLNGRPVLSTEELSNADMIRIGESTLRFVGFCSPEFAWDLTDTDADEEAHARAG